MLRQDLRVPKDHKAILGSSKSNIETARVAQEPNALMIVGAHTGKNDEVFLSSLKRIHRSYFNLFVGLLLVCTIGLHRTDYVASLSLIRCDDTNILWLNASFEEASDNLLDIGSFCAV